MIDIHCHILPGIDQDGPATHQESVDMARAAAQDGIKIIIATPHIKQHDLSSEHINQLVGILNQKMQSANIPIRILPGAEINAVLDPVYFSKYALNGGKYILVEFCSWMNPELISETIHEACLSGLHPIIAHAERIPAVQRMPNLVIDLVRQGAFVQITAESMTGGLGTEARICARFLLRQSLVHFLATDAHSNISRRPILSEGLHVASKIIGDVAAENLVKHNPALVVQGKLLHA